MEEYRTVHIVGAGTLGAGLAHCAALAGLRAVLIDRDPAALASARDRIARDHRALRLTGGLATAKADADPLARIECHASDAPLADASFVLECATERIDVKEPLYRAMDAACPQHAILATNTSAIPVATIASWTRRPDRVLAIHFMNPPQWKHTVELAPGAQTSGETLSAATRLLAAMGKQAVAVADGPGFVINRILMLEINEAAQVVHEARADAAAVDRLFRECLGHRSGPLETADLIGLDNVRDTLRVLQDFTGDARYRPSAILDTLVAQGHLGRKSGRGFHLHPAP